jgi:hypothetical protein
MPTYPSRETLTHPDLEELAAFLDGKLPEADRARVEEHLAECRDCHEIFVGAVRFQEDSSTVVPFAPRQSPVRRWLPLAAAALLAVAVGAPIYRTYMAPPDMAVAELTAAYQEDAQAASDKLWLGTQYRGEPGQDSAYERDSFQLGVQATNLQVVLQADDRETSSGIIIPQIRGLLESGSFFGTELDITGYQQIRGEIEGGRPARELLAQAAERDAHVREQVDPLYFDFGKWAAAARLAAVTRNAGFFDRRDNRRFPSWFLKEEGDSIQEPEVVASLQKIQEILRQDEIDHDALQKNLETVLRTYDD